MAGPSQAYYAPDPVQSTQLIPGGNTPASGAQLFVYLVGSSTKQNSYTDASASTARTNPIVLDSGGNIPGNGEVWIASSAKFVLAPFNDSDPPVSPYWTRDAVPGINNVAALIASTVTGEWVQGSTATFVGVTAFSVVGDQTALYTLGRRIKAAVTGGDRFGIVTSSVLAGASTAVGVTLDSSTLNGGLSSVQYGLLSTPNGSLPWTQFASTGIFFEGAVTTGVLIATSTVNSPNFVPTGTTAPLSGLYLPAALNPAIAANSSKVIDFTSSTVNVPTGITVNVTSGVVNASSFSVGPSSAASGVVRVPYNKAVASRNSSNAGDLNLITALTVNGQADVIRVGGGTFGVDGGGSIQFFARAHAGPPSTVDIPAGNVMLWVDTSATTTRFYFNNGAVIQSSAAFA